MPKFLIVGAGVIGLTVADVLFEQVKGAQVTIVAELTPEDPLSIRYTSQWAGAHQAATMAQKPDMKQLRWDEETYHIALKRHKQDPSMPLLFCRHTQYFEYEQAPGSTPHLMNKWLPSYAHFVDKSKLPEGCVEGIVYDSFSYDTPNYLLWLWGRFKRNGGRFIRKTLSHLDEAITTTGSDVPTVLIHCSGLGALGLANDKAMFPTRGQTLVVRAPWVKSDWTRKYDETDAFYVIPRRSGNIIIGGTREANDTWPYPRPETSENIRKNCVKRKLAR